MFYVGGFTFLCDGEPTFLMTSLKDLLDKKGITTDKCDIGMRNLGNIQNLPYAFIVDAALLNQYPESRVFLYDLCIEKMKKLILIGDPEALEHVLGGVSQKIICAIFERPINIQEIAEKLNQINDDSKNDEMKKKILVVDDSPMFLRTIAEWIGDDYTVSICPSATAAFHMIEVNKPDLILLDYEMPICSGAQFLEMLHSESISADIPVMFLTSKSDKDTVNKVLALKPQGYLLKNLPKAQILSSIADFFNMEKGK